MSALASHLKSHREQRQDGYRTIGCSCGWAPASTSSAGPLLTQWAEHVAETAPRDRPERPERPERMRVRG